MIKKITTLVSTNKESIIKKSVIVGSVIGGLVLGVLLARPDESVIIEGETVEDTEQENTPEED